MEWWLSWDDDYDNDDDDGDFDIDDDNWDCDDDDYDDYWDGNDIYDNEVLLLRDNTSGWNSKLLW